LGPHAALVISTGVVVVVVVDEAVLSDVPVLIEFPVFFLVPDFVFHVFGREPSSASFFSSQAFQPREKVHEWQEKLSLSGC
jgi:hypothetical protein